MLLGTARDAELAARIGRTENAVRIMRNRRGMPKAVARCTQEDGATLA